MKERERERERERESYGTILHERNLLSYTSLDGLISTPLVLDQYIVLKDYKKQNKSDINLAMGQTVEVIEKRDTGEILSKKNLVLSCSLAL